MEVDEKESVQIPARGAQQDVGSTGRQGSEEGKEGAYEGVLLALLEGLR